MPNHQIIALSTRLFSAYRSSSLNVARTIVPGTNHLPSSNVPIILRVAFSTRPPLGNDPPSPTSTVSASSPTGPGHQISLTSEVIESAVESGSTRVVRALLDAGMSVDEDIDKVGTPLIVAIYTRNLEMVKLLLNRGANPDGWVYMWAHSYLARAAALPSQDILLAMLEYGAHISNDALFLVAEKGNVAAAKVLLDNGADVNGVWDMNLYTDEEQLRGTALHAAVEHGHVEMVKLLLSRGARKDLLDWHSKGAREVAEEHGRTEIVELLDQVE